MFSQNDARNCYEIHFGKTQRCSQAAVGLKPPLSTYQFRNTDVCFIYSVNFHQPFSSDWMHCGKFGGSASRRRNTLLSNLTVMNFNVLRSNQASSFIPAQSYQHTQQQLSLTLLCNRISQTFWATYPLL